MKYLIFIYVFWTVSLFGQSIEPQLISSIGFYNLEGEVKLHYAIGESAISTNRNGIILKEGFYQASSLLTSTSFTNLLGTETEVFPNPTLEFVTVKFAGINTLDIKIMDILGREVFAERTVQSGAKLDLSALQTGSYLLILANDKGQFNTHKIIKK